MTRHYAVLCSFGLTILVGCEPPTVPQPVRPVRAMKIGDIASITGRSLPGRASAAEEVNLSFRVSGPLVELPVRVGQQVTRGETLAQIDPTDFRIAVDEAKARLAREEQTLLGMRTGRPEDIRKAEETLNAALAEANNADIEVKRNRRLLEDSAVARSEYDRSVANLEIARARVESARENLSMVKEGARAEDIAAKEAEIRSLKASVENAENQLAYSTLQAPFGGTIAATFVENFQTVQAKQLIVRLVDKSRIEITVALPEQGIHMVAFVKQVNCVFDAFPEKTFTGKITEVGTEASQTTRTFPVTITIEQQFADEGITILPGMSCEVRGEVELPERAFAGGAEVPETAVFDDGTGKFVWVIDEATETVRRQSVTPGDLTPYGILVNGIEVGQWIATAGVHSLEEGQKVRLMKDESS